MQFLVFITSFYPCHIAPLGSDVWALFLSPFTNTIILSLFVKISFSWSPLSSQHLWICYVIQRGCFFISPFELVLESRQATTELQMDHIFDLGTTRYLTFNFSHCLQFFSKTPQHNSHQQAKDEES